MHNCNLRNLHKIELARLKRTDHLVKQLEKKPMESVVVEPKINGRRYTLQLGPEGLYVTSRGKHGKSHGVDASSGNDFVTQEPESWMREIKSNAVIILDGEIATLGDDSTSSTAGRSDTEKRFVVFDLLWDDEDLRSATWNVRRTYLEKIIKELDHPRLELIESLGFELFSLDNLKTILGTIPELQVEGFCLKPRSRVYDKNNYGWKIKAEDTEDGFIVAASEGKKHELGDVQKTGNVGAFGLAQYKPDGKSQLVAWVGVKAEQIPLVEWKKHEGKVIEFLHSGWDVGAQRYAFPRFVEWRSDKGAKECKIDPKCLS